MNKYAFGTILGISLLSLTKHKLGSRIKLTKKKVSCLEFHFWSYTQLIEPINGDNLDYVKMDKIQLEKINPKLKKETFIDEGGLITFLNININMEPYDDDNNWQNSFLEFCYFIPEKSPWLIMSDTLDRYHFRKAIIKEIINRYGAVYNIIRNQNSLLEKIFKEYGIDYYFQDDGDAWEMGETANHLVFSINEEGIITPYTQPESTSKLRRR